VNLERPLRADSRFGGHFVQGHIDAIGHVEEFRPDSEFHWLTVSFPAHWAPVDVMFYEGKQFPAKYQGGAFIAFHGSWNRTPEQRPGAVVFQPVLMGKPRDD
jgi:glucose/arabinose dehydrogenase